MYQQWMKIGWAQVNITPTRPVYNAGQIYERISQYVHDPITATALVLDNGNEQAAFISADMVSVPIHVIEIMKEKLSSLEGFDVNKVSINVTHTHNSSNFDAHETMVTYKDLIDRSIMPPIDVPEDIFAGEEAKIFLADKLSEAVAKAWETRTRGGISYALDYAAIAFNRRPVFEIDGMEISKMYGVCSDNNFKRFEGSSDHTADMLYTWDLSGNLTGIMVNIPCPSQVFELHSLISADFWASARKFIRERLGNVYILPLCGAAGDQCPLDLVRISKTNVKTLQAHAAQAGEVFRNFDMLQECNDIGLRIADAVVRGYNKARNYIDTNPIFRHKVLKMSLPIRKVSYDEYVLAKKQIEELKSKFTPENPMKGADMVAAFEPVGVIRRWDMQNNKDSYECDVHILRIGNISVATNPFELFCEYGMRIKARTKSEQTFIVQLANGGGGYLPTKAAIEGGSYSSKPASTMCGPDGGDLLVENTIAAINELWE